MDVPSDELVGLGPTATDLQLATVELPPSLAGWRLVILLTSAVIVLAGLDFAGAVIAKEWALTHDTRLFVAGLAVFAVLFAVYAVILQVADLSIVTMGWIALLQVSLLLVDRLRYGVHLGASQWTAVVLVLLLQGYLVLSSTGPRGS